MILFVTIINKFLMFCPACVVESNIDKKLSNKNRKKEWWISSEAKDLGIVDDIIEDIEETFK